MKTNTRKTHVPPKNALQARAIRTKHTSAVINTRPHADRLMIEPTSRIVVAPNAPNASSTNNMMTTFAQTLTPGVWQSHVNSLKEVTQRKGNEEDKNGQSCLSYNNPEHLSEVQCSDGGPHQNFKEAASVNSSTTNTDSSYSPPDDFDFSMNEEREIEVGEWNTDGSAMSTPPRPPSIPLRSVDKS